MSEVHQHGDSCFAASVASLVEARLDDLPPEALDPDEHDVWQSVDRWLRTTRGQALTFVRLGELARPRPALRRFLTREGVSVDPARLLEPPVYAREAAGGRFVALLRRRRGDGATGHACVAQSQAGAIVVVHDPARFGFEPGEPVADLATGLVFVVHAAGLPEPSPWPTPPG
jgi:hypothetical protein